MNRGYIVRLGDKVIRLPSDAFDDIDELFKALDGNLAAAVDWETMTLVPNNPAYYPRDMGDRTPEDYEHKEGRNDKPKPSGS